ncbi:hypothetical protein J6T66_04405 [bacterium]|nr:hypothetical protein [bacterium]
MLFATHAITGAAHVPVPHHIHAVMNTMSASHNACLISFSDSSAAFLQISGFAHAQSHFVIFIQMLTLEPAKLAAKSWASVLTATNSTPSSPCWIILLRALFPPQPIHTTLILAPGVIGGRVIS